MAVLLYFILVVGLMVSLPILRKRAKFEIENELVGGYFYLPMKWQVFVLNQCNNKEDTYEYSNQTRSE